MEFAGSNNDGNARSVPHPVNDNCPVPLDWTRGPLADGLACYRSGHFFLAHEHWEAVWLTLHQPEKDFLQALIQVAAAFHHLQRANRPGARSLLTRALRRLSAYPPAFGHIHLTKLRDQLHRTLQHLTTTGDPSNLTAPPIEPLL
jgi:predicted metal-dependent hydrolase